MGAGIFGDNSRPLTPTQRFYQLQQLSKTPEGLKALPLSTQSSNIISRVVGDREKGDYAAHIINRGGSRTARLTGMDNSVEWMR